MALVSGANDKNRRSTMPQATPESRLAGTAKTILDPAEVLGSDTDLLGPLQIATFENAALGAQAILVSHNISRGPAIGGVRCAGDVTPREVYELARAMTWKNAAAL